jgi:D-amino-acid dehydrogenase
LQRDMIVVGAGVVGVSAALHLQARGRSVALVDRLGKVASETSYGNTGIVQSEAVYPYTFPRKFDEIVRAGLNLDPRAHIRYSALPFIAPFLLKYFRASATDRRAQSARGLRALVERAVAEHVELAQAAAAGALLREGGWIKVFRTDRGRDAGLREAEEVAPFGVPFQTLSREDLLKLEPHLGEAAISGVHFTDPLTTPNPTALIESYAALFLKRGGVFLRGDANSLSPSGPQWRMDTESGVVSARDVVLALGPWTDTWAQSLRYRFPFGVKRGYHMHYSPRGNAELARPVLDYERGYVVTPMQQGLRLTTGAEFARADDPPSNAHLNRLEPFGREIFPLGERKEPAPWLGRRPCLPDMLPMIGAAPRHNGLWFNFGHQHLGLTLGPISGRLLADLVTGTEPVVDPRPYAPDRF